MAKSALRPLAPQLDLSIPESLPGAIRERLAAEGVTTLQGWRALGSQRHEIFGVTAVWCARLDELAREVSQ